MNLFLLCCAVCFDDDVGQLNKKFKCQSM